MVCDFLYGHHLIGVQRIANFPLTLAIPFDEVAESWHANAGAGSMSRCRDLQHGLHRPNHSLMLVSRLQDFHNDNACTL